MRTNRPQLPYPDEILVQEPAVIRAGWARRSPEAVQHAPRRLRLRRLKATAAALSSHVLHPGAVGDRAVTRE